MYRAELRLQFVPVSRAQIRLEILRQHHRQQHVAEVGGIALVIDFHIRALARERIAKRSERAGSDWAD
jgi:hypothetical protein